jgi:nucleotide-binding universal stress UspA family protein
MKVTTSTKILFPVDFSKHGEQALKMAVSLARDLHGELVLLHVEEPPLAYGGGEFYYGMPEPNREQLKRMLNEVSIGDTDLPVTRHVEVGSPATVIVQFAKDHDMDYIVMPTHGRTGLNRLLMGSVTEEVVRKAPCPVITVKGVSAVKERTPPVKESCHV